MNRQRLLLAGLSGLLVLALAYAFWASPRPQRVAPAEDAPSGRRSVGEAPAAQSGQASAGEEAHVRLELLRREGEDFAGYRRDIFNYPPPPAPPPAAPPVRSPVRPSAGEPTRAPTEEVEEPPSFTFLGFVEKGEDRTVFLASDGEIFLVREGERFGDENEYRLSGLTEETLTIRYGEDERSVAIPITEPPLPSAPVQELPSLSPEADFSDREGEFLLPEDEGEVLPEDEALPQEESDFAMEEEDGEAMEAGEGGAVNNEEAADE